MSGIVVIFAASLGSASAAASKIECPAEISVVQKLGKLPHCWESGSRHNARYLLRSVAFFDGHPSELAHLKPDDEGEHSLVTQLDPNTKGGSWVACEYTDTSAVLWAKLPDGTKRCKVEYDASIKLGGYWQGIRSIECE